jgi:hypothetical protein
MFTFLTIYGHHKCMHQGVTELRELLSKMRRLREERLSPKSWTMMAHVMEHLPEQLLHWGPTRELRMFCMESFFGYMKRLLRNRSHAAASIMAAYQRRRVAQVFALS